MSVQEGFQLVSLYKCVLLDFLTSLHHLDTFSSFQILSCAYNEIYASDFSPFIELINCLWIIASRQCGGNDNNSFDAFFCFYAYMYVCMNLIGHQFLSQITHQQRLKKRQADHLSYVRRCMLNEPQNRIAPNLIIGANRVCKETLIQFNWRYLDLESISELLLFLNPVESQLDIPKWMVKSLRWNFSKHFPYLNSFNPSSSIWNRF